MKRIGIIGGLGPESTVDYYKAIIGAFTIEGKQNPYPEIVLYSVNIWELMDLLKREEYNSIVRFFLQKIDCLKAAGADFAAITANTPHIVFERIKEKSSLPLISIVEAACRRVLAGGYKRPGLMGTQFTMEAAFYPEVFNRENLRVEIPDSQDRDYIHEKLFAEIELGIFKDETRAGLEAIIQRMAEKKQIDCVILGCTELPLILPQPAYESIPALNTTQIHVDEIVNYCLRSE